MTRFSLSRPRRSERRQGVVLLAVLVVLVLLSLIAYNYSDMMISEYQGSAYDHKQAQARAYADSGVHYVMGMLTTPDITTMAGGNPFDNASVFRNHSVGPGFFTAVAPLNPNNTAGTGPCQYGVIDEASKININAMIVADPTGQKLNTMLMQLPNMTSDVAASIVNWVLSPSATPLQGGAASDYYGGLSPPYNIKNGPLDSIEELLLVQGVTPQLLFGGDLNRNGYQDESETDTGNGLTSGFDRGWSAYLTVYSREQNVDANGLALTNLNDSTVDLETMYGTLTTNLSDDLAKFIIMYKQYGTNATILARLTVAMQGAGGANAATGAKGPTGAAGGTGAKGPGGAKGAAGAGGGAGAGAGAGANGPAGATGMMNVQLSTGAGGNFTMKIGGTSTTSQPGVLSSFTLDTTKAATNKVNSLYDLINATVTVPNSDPKKPSTVYKSPLSDPSQQSDLLPKLFQTTTVFAATEIPARINVNTALPEVLTALPGLSTADVTAIVAAQPQYGSADAPAAQYLTPAWLVTQANISPSKLSKLEPLITTRSQVYRVQSLGYADQSKGPVARIEAVIDANIVSVNGVATGQPRILFWRDMSDFGRVRPPQ